MRGLPGHQTETAWAESEIGEPLRDVSLVYVLDGRRTMRLVSESGRIHFFKVARALRGECERLGWLSGRLPVPRVCAFHQATDVDWLLTEGLPGEDLTSERHRADPHQVVELLASALRQIHELDASDCPFREGEQDGVIIHGDACLPNFVVNNGRLSGVIDVGLCRVGSPTVDLEAAVWSLRHNLGDGWGGRFLDAYGWHVSDPETVRGFVASYERQR